MTQVIQLAASLVLALVLLIAAQAKLRDASRTRIDFESLGLVGAGVLVWLVPLAEIASATALVLVPAVGGPLAFALLAGFTVVLFKARRFGAVSGEPASCACFGGTSSEPISNRHFARNVTLMALALLATTAEWNAFELLA